VDILAALLQDRIHVTIASMGVWGGTGKVTYCLVSVSPPNTLMSPPGMICGLGSSPAVHPP